MGRGYPCQRRRPTTSHSGRSTQPALDRIGTQAAVHSSRAQPAAGASGSAPMPPAAETRPHAPRRGNRAPRAARSALAATPAPMPAEGMAPPLGNLLHHNRARSSSLLAPTPRAPGHKVREERRLKDPDPAPVRPARSVLERGPGDNQARAQQVGQPVAVPVPRRKKSMGTRQNAASHLPSLPAAVASRKSATAKWGREMSC